MIAYGIQGMQCATIETVKDTKTKTIIENLINSDDLTKLADDDAINNLMTEAGISLRLNENTKNGIIKGLIMHGSTVTKKQAMYEQLWKGAYHLSLRTLLIENQGQLEKILCHKCGSTETLRAEALMKLFDITKYGRRGSNNRNRSEEVAQNFESFVYDCEDGKCCYTDGRVTIEDVLKFVTGCSNVPPGGFDARFILGFTEEKRYPSVSTCTFEVTLPLNLTEFKMFKDVMIEAIVSGPGFGQV
ncbi:G2/M phase-specific E3 ubiquitin-protein ligase-like [Mytilus californianus]|uniref:G2/M phase-specific E3 ubiquitin-protein ligase-like n=1 Tax=Mytilus californianus TaxID=6549 RepID=UPI002247DFB0|nr:G2/M phase-specific E3 ubiquitin-protein ligase-like [Mytilus californianus]XP_052081184.1 G2/M phase-specific E3 ubiquitin-protein ligase-like [Mytilus californianus]